MSLRKQPRDIKWFDQSHSQLILEPGEEAHFLTCLYRVPFSLQEIPVETQR